MGICASCLGRNRHNSQEIDETDALLGESQHSTYGGIGNGEYAQPDEEELRREREMLEHITAEAADNMIDVSQPTAAELSNHFTHTNHDRPSTANKSESDGGKDGTENEEESEDAEENAWLQSIQSAGLDSQVKGLETGGLVMDISQLRQEPPLNSVKKNLKSALR